MRYSLRTAFFAASALAALASVAVAAPNPSYIPYLTNDAPFTVDDPLVTRGQGWTILNQVRNRLDELTLPSGPAVGMHYSDTKHWSKTVTAEGRVTRTVYVVPAGISSLEVIRTFQSGLAAKGFTTTYQCAEAKCGDAFARLKYYWSDKATLVDGPGMETDRSRFVPAVFDAPKAIRYALMQRGTGPTAAYAGLYVALNDGGTNGDVSDTLTGHVTALVEVVEPGGS